MVSRLPKFGGRSSTGGTSPLSNGSTQPTTPTQDGKTIPPGTRPNGVIRASPFSLKWKRDEGTTPSSPSSPSSPGDGGEEKAQTQFPSFAKEVKNGSPATPKMRRSGSLMVAVSSPKAIPKQSLKMRAPQPLAFIFRAKKASGNWGSRAPHRAHSWTSCPYSISGRMWHFQHFRMLLISMGF